MCGGDETPRARGRCGDPQVRGIGGPRLRQDGLPRHTFLQDQLGGLHARVGVKARDEHVAAHDVRERHERHALVMTEESPDDLGAVAPHRKLGRGERDRGAVAVVQGFVETVPADGAHAHQPPHVGGGFRWIDQAGQRRGVRRHHQVVLQPAFQAEAGHAERAVLIRPRAIRDRIRGLRHAPRNPAIARVVHLTPDTRAAALIQQRAGERAHDDERHQVLEHRAAPGHERRAAVHAGHQPAELEPVVLRHVALGDRDKAGQPRFGRQQVVEGVVRAARTVRVREAIADGEHAAAPVVQEGEVHRVGETCRACGERGERRRRVVGQSRVDIGLRALHRGGPERALVIVGGRRQRREHIARVRDAVEPLLPVWGADASASSACVDRHEDAREIAAVDGRHVLRPQRFARRRVIPVEEMSVMALEALERRQRPIEPLDERRAL